MNKILIVEDDDALLSVLVYNLERAGYQVLTAHDGADGLRQAQMKQPDLVLLDLMLPVLDGLEVCRRLRASADTRSMLVVILTAKAEETDELVGLSLGADDYVTKPFSVKVLLERIKAHLRRRAGTLQNDREFLTGQQISIDRRSYRVTAGGDEIKLTNSEFRLLETLLRQPGRVFTRTELINAALGDDAVVTERTIDVHIRAVRKKLGEFSDRVETVRGVGYRFRSPAAIPE